MTSEFFRNIALKVAGEEIENEASTWSTGSQLYGAAFDQMSQYFTIAYNKLSPTQRMQVAEEITKITKT